jgi:zinc protease
MSFFRGGVARALIGFAALAGAVAAVPDIAWSQAAPTASIKPEKLNYKTSTLKNGLRVITLEDHRAPVVTVQVYYRVGSKDEQPGRSGFAHLFEHLMFKGSKNVGPEEHARFVEQVGAQYNAYTHWDRTVYYETVPINALDRMLFLEADRMTSLRVDEANLKTERETVKEEYRLRVANPPYGNLLTDVLALSYPESHPYHHPAIGSIPDLDAAKLTDVQAFHAEYYKPDNATLVLVGDFKTGDILKKVEQYFGSIPRSDDGKFIRVPVPANTQTAAQRQTSYDPKAPLPLVGMVCRLPAPTDPDAYAFDVITQILSAGQSSRLNRSLVREKQIAVQAQGTPLTLQLGGLFFFFALANQGKTPADLEAALSEEIEKLRTTPVSAAELDKARNQLLTGLVFGDISTEQKANALGEADLLYGTPEEVNLQFAKLSAVTAADIQRVAQKYFAPEKRNVFYILPASMKPKEN